MDKSTVAYSYSGILQVSENESHLPATHSHADELHGTEETQYYVPTCESNFLKFVSGQNWPAVMEVMLMCCVWGERGSDGEGIWEGLLGEGHIVSPLHVNFQVVNFQRCLHLVPARNQNLCHQRQVWVKLQLALHLLLLTILQIYHLPPLLPPAISNSSCLFTRCQPLDASCCTVLLYFPRYCTIKLKMLYFLFFKMYYLCEKYYRPIPQY